jgi:NTE family protein
LVKQLGVALSGGGAKALCYWGFLRQLAADGIKPSYLSAHSGAAILLCYVEAGLTEPDLLRAWARFRYWRFVSFNPIANRGLFSYDRYIQAMSRHTHGKDIADMDYDTVIYTSDLTDFDAPQRVVHSQGDLATIAVVSSLTPPLFPLYRDGDRLLGDGGYTSTYSAAHMRGRGADVVVGLYPSGLRFTRLPFKWLIGDEVQVARALLSQVRRHELAQQPVDLEIDFGDVPLGLNDYRQAAALFQAGQAKARMVLPQLRGLLAGHTPLVGSDTEQ